MILCPSIGPKYLNPKASNKLLLLETIPFNPASTLEAVSLVNVLPIGNLPIRSQSSSLNLLYVGEVLISVKYSLSAPTFGSMLMQLSFKIINTSLSATPAWFIASNAIPAVMDPSPIMATDFLFSPLYLAAMDIPNAAEMEVEE